MTRMMSVQKVSLLFWPPINFICFHYLPFHTIIPFMNLMALIYSCMLSFINNRGSNESKTKAGESVGMAAVETVGKAAAETVGTRSS